MSDQGPSDLDSHSFIVKIWIEHTATDDEKTTWRGHITHVPGAERRYVRKLSEITAFIASYLQAMGVATGIRRRIKKWLWG
jgi:hypothetical protein